MPRPSTWLNPALLGLSLMVPLASLAAGPNRFDTDPRWEGYRNRLVPDDLPVTRQDFGHRTSRKAGGRQAGEIGGRVQRSVTPAYYAKGIEQVTLDQKLNASGRFAVHNDESNTGTLFGWFNAELSRGWRTAHSLAFRIDGNGGKYWVFFEYGTGDWMTGCRGCFEGDAYQTTKTKPFPADGTPHDWTLVYDPAGADGNGLITFTLDGTPYDLPLAPGHKQRGATFNQFGIFNQQAAGGGMDVFFDDLVLNGRPIDLGTDPKWDAKGNHVEFQDRVRRPLHDFGFSPTRHAGGKAAGEIGGLVWRDEAPSYYADKVGPLGLDDALTASGKVAFTGAGSDSGVYIGWFDSTSKRAAPAATEDRAQRNFLAILIEGPSRVGHYFRPCYRCADGGGVTADDGAIVRPDGRVHDWAIRYDPAGAGGNGLITVTFDNKDQSLPLRPGDKARGATFDRFGLFNLQSGGNYVFVYVDDLAYTFRHNP
jgi:hypothetical protein